MHKYVVITPAHNEEAFIEATAKSMVSQTIPPMKWVVVNDGSVDQTGEIVEQYVRRFPFIQLVTQSRDPERNFARKVFAFNRGLAEVQGLDFEFIGNVDADISFGADYFRTILLAFQADPQLGVSGGIVYTKFTQQFVTYDTTLDSVGGKVQLFRRQCFEDIGGYRPLTYGGIDATAEIMARMKGWKVRKSLETRAYEHRPTGFAYGKPLTGKFYEGRRFFSLGYDPIFYFLRCLYRLNEHPFMAGSTAALLGYLYAQISRETVVLPVEVVRYLRTEQRSKLKQVLRFCSRGGSTVSGCGDA